MVSQRTVESGFALATALFGAVVAWGATEFGVGWSPSGPEPGTFPFYIGIIVALASLGNFIFALKPAPDNATSFVTRAQAGQVLRFVLPIIAFVILALFLGLYVATAIYIFTVMRFQGQYPLWHSGLIALGLPVFLYLLLEKGFQVPLLKGPLEAALGL